MLLVVTYSREARTALRNACHNSEAAVVERIGRAALLAATELGAFVALRLRARHGADVWVGRAEPFNEFADVPEAVRTAATAYEERDSPYTPYAKFAAGTDHPAPERMADREL